jgi:hypothetical protein
MGGGGNRDVVLTRDALRRMPGALNTEQTVDVERIILNGGYAAGGGQATVFLDNPSGSRIFIINVHPVNLTRDCMPLAAAVIYLNEGGEPPAMKFNMDAGSPAPRDLRTSEPYFDAHGPIELEAGAQEVLVINFDTVWGAYTYELAFDYLLNGKRYTAIIDNRGGPFRVASNLCGVRTDLDGLPESARQRLTSLRYENIRGKGPGDSVEVKSPDEYAAGCFNS